nr:retrovirus-related Pol polyprotein from transposon TNT 1-94 [Tanacetum cinerariifolium]
MLTIYPEARSSLISLTTHTLIWRNKTDLDEQSLDDLFNNLTIYEAEVKSSSSTRTSTQNIAFVSTSNTDSTNEPVSDAASVSAVSAKIPVSLLPNVDSLSNAVIYLFFARQSNSPQLDNDDLNHIDVADLEEMDLTWKGHFVRECRSPKDIRKNGAAKPQMRNVLVETSTSTALVSQCDGVGSYDWSFQAKEEPTNYALLAFSSSSSSFDNELRDNALVSLRQNLKKAERERDDLKRNGYHTVSPPYTGTFMPLKPDLVFNNAPNDVETDHSAFTIKLSPTRPDQDLSHTHRPSAPIIEDWVSDSDDESETKTPQNVPSFVQPTEQTVIPKPTSNGKRRNRRACFVCKRLDHLIKDCNYHEKKMAQPTARNHAQRGNHKHYARMSIPNPQRHVVPAAVLTQSKLVLINAVRPVSTDVPKISVTRPGQAKTVVTKTNSPPRRHIDRSPSPKASTFPPKVTTVKAPMVNAAYGNPQHTLKDKGVIDSGCSRHMTGNMSYLSDFEKLNGGYVAFGRNPKGGKIFGKGKIRTGKLDFDDVYFVKELKFNLFSVSQMCDKKNGVLFTDTECLVLPPEFKLPDESQVLLRVLRENNMYNVNLKNIVPSGDLTCLFEKATLDESNLLHRRLGHINFKTMNKLVNGNLVRGLLSKVFKNDNTCVACKKDKQHRAFCKTKPNRILVTKPQNKTPYELLHGRTPSIGFMRPFGCLVTILNTLDSLGKFDGKVNEGFLVGYSVSSKSFRVFNSRTRIVKETLHAINIPLVHVSKNNLMQKKQGRIVYNNMCFFVWSSGSTNPQNTDGDAAFDEKEPEFEGRKHESEDNVSPSSSAQSKKHDDKTKREAKGNKLEDITNSDDEDDVGIEVDFNNLETSITVSPIPTTKVHKDHHVTQIIDDLSLATQIRNMTRVVEIKKVWVLVDLPYEKRAIGTKWVFRNKKNQRGIVVRNKARLIAQEHTQEEGIDYEEVFAPVSRIEAIRLFLAYVSFMGFMVYQMDVKSAFLYGTIEEELYVCQPPGFEGLDYPDKVYKVVKALYGLHQAPRAWQKGDILLVQIYLDDIIFGLQVKQKKDRIFISQDKYVAKILRKFGLTEGKSASTPIDTEKPLLKDLDGLDRKSTTGGCQFFECRLISWQCKKQTVMATSSTKAEYVAAASCCAQVLWIQNQMLDYGMESLKRMVHVTNILSAGSLTTPQMVLNSPCLAHIKNWLVQIKRSLTSVAVKKVNDVMRLQALVDKKNVVITEALIRDALRLDDAEGIECLLNQEIFAELARMGYEKPSTKLTFYKAFFLSQWKFLIHTILQCMSAKRTSWNKFSSSMASAVICLSSGRKFNFSKKQVGDLSSHSTKYTSSALTQKVFANMRWVGKGFSGLDTPLFEGAASDDVNAAVDEPSIPSPILPTPPPQPSQDIPSTSRLKIDTSDDTIMDDVSKQKGIIANIDADEDVVLEDAKDVAVEKSANEEESEPAELQEVVDVVTTAKIITEVVTAASTTIIAADVPIPAATIVVAPTLTAASSRRRKGVVIRDPQKTVTPSIIIHSEAKSKYKGKGILVEEPKPLKKQAQIKQDEKYARELEAELNKNIDWDEVIDHVQRKQKEDKAVKIYQALKRKPQTETQARKNMMIYLRNVAGFKMDYFKGMSYDDIRSIFEKHFDSNVAFLQKTKEQIDEEDSRALKRLNEMPNDEDDIYTEATPLARKVFVVDYEIYNENNKPYYKIKRADGSHQLYLSFLSLLRNFDREDLKALWRLVKERFATTKPKKFSDDFLLITLGAMFEKPDIHAQI